MVIKDSEVKLKLQSVLDITVEGLFKSIKIDDARRFFANPEVTQVTSVDAELITNFGVIFQVISCGEFVDMESSGNIMLRLLIVTSSSTHGIKCRQVCINYSCMVPT